MEFSEEEKEYHDILQKLEDYHLAQIVEKSDEWAVIHKAAKFLYDTTQEQMNSIDFSQPGAEVRAVACQVALGFYGDFFNTLISKYREIGQEAYETAKEAGWLQKISALLKKDN